MVLARMADSIDAATLPDGLPAYAGYVDGAWPSFGAVCRRFYPRAHCISITVLGGNARFCDCEAGDLTVLHAAEWLAARVSVEHGGLWTPRAAAAKHIAPQWRPGIYFPVSLTNELHTALAQVAPRLQRTAYCLWGAHWVTDPPAVLPADLDALQYRAEVSPGYDMSIIGPRFLSGDPTVANSAA